MPEPETPIEEWRTSRPDAKGRTYQYVVLKGPGGGVIRRQGAETPDEARMRHAIGQEGKRRAQRDQAAGTGTADRPKGKGRPADKPPTPAPGSEEAKRQKELRPTEAQLAAAAELPFAVLGAFVGRSVLGCDYCARSMQANAPLAARDLAKSKSSYVRQLLTWWHGILYMGAGREGLALFAGIPVVHHYAPDPMYGFVAPFMGMPPRQPKPTSAHAHAAHQGATGAQPPPGPVTPGASPPPPAPSAPAAGNGGAPAMSPQLAHLLAANPGLQEALRRGDPDAHRFVAEATRSPQPPQPPPPPPPAQPGVSQAELEAELAALQAERARLLATSDMAAREMARAAAMPGGNIPAYRAEETLNPTQVRQIREAEESRQMGGTLPNYTGGRESAPGTPSASGADAAESAGSPLPPEALA